MTDLDQAVTQAVITSQTEIDPTQATERLALFDETGNPIDLSTLGFPDYTGTGSPEGVLEAPVGKFYLDEEGALYIKLAGTGDTGWAVFGSSEGIMAGFTIYGDAGVGSLQTIVLGDLGVGAGVFIGDVVGYNSNGSGIYWSTEDGVDGHQKVRIILGDEGQFTTQFNADGSTSFPGAFGINGVTPPAQSDHGTTAADAIACLVAHGLMKAS